MSRNTSQNREIFPTVCVDISGLADQSWDQVELRSGDMLSMYVHDNIVSIVLIHEEKDREVLISRRDDVSRTR